MDDLPIRTNHSGGGRCWYTLSRDDDDFTEAMNAHRGVLVRTRVESTEWATEETKTSSMGLGLVFVAGCQVGQRWSVLKVEPELDEGIKGHILLQRERAIIEAQTLVGAERELIMFGRFRWYCADEVMPRPTDSQVRDLVAGRSPASDADALREQVDALRVELEDATRPTRAFGVVAEHARGLLAAHAASVRAMHDRERERAPSWSSGEFSAEQQHWGAEDGLEPPALNEVVAPILAEEFGIEEEQALALIEAVREEDDESDDT